MMQRQSAAKDPAPPEGLMPLPDSVAVELRIQGDSETPREPR